MRLRPSQNPRSTAAAALLLSACGLNTFGLSDGSTATTTSGGSTDSIVLTGSSAGTATASDGSTTPPTGEPLPDAATLQLSFSQIKQFDFTWSPAAGADHYQLLERVTSEVDYVQLGEDIVGEAISVTMPLHFRLGASYLLRACNAGGCTDSEPVDVVDSMAAAVGYFKASNTDADDHFGARVALSADGNTLIIGSAQEDSITPVIDGNQDDDTALDAGGVYVFVRNGTAWSQEAYLKASNPGPGDYFGARLAVSDIGNTLAVGAYSEDSASVGVDGDQNNNGALNAGAVYMFVRVDGVWSQQAYLKASNTDANDTFGGTVALSADGNTLAVGAAEDGNGIGGQSDDSADAAGAVYVFVREKNIWSQRNYLKASDPGLEDAFGISLALSDDGNTLAVGAALERGIPDGAPPYHTGAVYVFVRMNGIWSEPDYLKASNFGESDRFGIALAMSGDGDTLVVGAYGETSAATGIGGNQSDNSTPEAGAVYVFSRANNDWSQQAYIKASNTGTNDMFGNSVALSADGKTLAVGAYQESSTATGVGGNQTDDSGQNAGAVYVFVRSLNNDWSQRAYLKAPNSAAGELFGCNVAVSSDGNTLAVGAYLEDGASKGIGGNQADNSVIDAGAAYLY